MFARGLEGLGITVIMTTRFDPNRIRERLTYWLDTAANEMANQAREQIKSSGVYYPDENGREKNRARKTAIESGIKNIDWVVRSVEPGKINATKKMIVSLATQLGLAIATYWIPGVGWAMALHSIIGMFGKKEKKPYPIPWIEIYSSAVPYAKAQTNKEELARIEAEGVRIETERQTAITKQSETAAMFKLPEGVTSITGGALVMNVQSEAKRLEPSVVKEIKPVGPAVMKKATVFVSQKPLPALYR